MGRGVDVEPAVAGRRDVAPMAGFEGDADSPLKGGAIGCYLDRTAAGFVTVGAFTRLRCPSSRPTAGRGRYRAWDRWELPGPPGTQSRGFTVLLWRTGDLGYALVSDVDQRELLCLEVKIAGSA